MFRIILSLKYLEFKYLNANKMCERHVNINIIVIRNESISATDVSSKCFLTTLAELHPLIF